jgi:hypothetical protein
MLSQFSNCIITISFILFNVFFFSSCVSRDSKTSNCRQHLTLLASRCVNCSSHIYCENCVNGGDSADARGDECEWIKDEARCVRRGRFEESVRHVGQCPSPCHSRNSCSACVGEPGRCVWCEETQVLGLKFL